MLCCSKRKDDKDDGLRPAGFIPIDANRWRTGEQKVPSRIENLNKEWLTVALRIKGHLKADGRVTSVEVRPIGEGLGMMADMALLHLTLEGALPGAPHRMVAKFAPQKQDKLPKFIVKFQLRNEAHFYNDFTVAGGGLPRPACYLAAERRRAKPTFLMLLEIVDDAVTYTRIGGCDVAEHLERAVGALGGLHARWWDHPRKAPLQWALHPHQGLGRVLFSRQYFAFSLSRALRAMRVWEPETFAPLLAWSELLTRAAPLVVTQCTTPPLTLVHGDAHLDNIFFADRFPCGCAFIDHANMMLAKPLLDVAFFLGTNLHPDVRRAQEVALLRRYHATLVAGGVEGYSWEACWTDYRWAMLQCLFGYACFVVQDYAKQKSNRTGVFAADQASVSKAERNLARVYSGDGPSSPGFNGRLVTALVDLKCDELLRDALSHARGPSSCCGGAPAATHEDRQMCADAAAAVAAPPSAAPAEAL